MGQSAVLARYRNNITGDADGHQIEVRPERFGRYTTYLTECLKEFKAYPATRQLIQLPPSTL